MDENERARFDSLLDLLTDEVARRLRQRHPDETDRGKDPEPSAGPAAADLPDERVDAPPAAESNQASEPGSGIPAGDGRVAIVDRAQTLEPVSGPDVGPMQDPTVPTPSTAAPLLVRLALGILFVVALINIPLNAEGTALARSIPSSASLVIRDGLVVKETSSPEFWVYREGTFHWIPSLDAFRQYGYRWENVHVVEDGFLKRYQKGSPLFPLLKCQSSDHVYRLEEGHKRWIVDLATFHAEGHRWEEVRYVDCAYLRNLPDGETIPPGSGTPPPPLP